MKKQLFAALCITLAPSAARAWDPTGHMLVGEIAWQNLKPEARAAITEHLKPLDPKHNDEKPYNSVTAGCWMDDMRADRSRAYMSKWHYIDVPYSPGAASFVEPEPPHALSALDDALRKLKDAATTPQEKAESLAVVMHLVGDIHMPLHCTDWDDRGGNEFLTRGVWYPVLPSYIRRPNLHFFWDQAFRWDLADGKPVELYAGIEVAGRPKAPGEGPIKEQADKIVAQFPRASLYDIAHHKTPRDWARESHVVGCLYVYPAGPHPAKDVPGELSPGYVQKARVIASQRVALAGYRLADTLNSLFAK